MLKLNLIVRAAVCILFVFVPLQSLDQWSYDQFFNLRGTLLNSSNFVLVEVNDADLFEHLSDDSAHLQPSKESVLFSPRAHSIWVDNFYSALLSKIAAAGPDVVVLTQYYYWTDTQNPSLVAPDKLLFASVLNPRNQLVKPLKAFRPHDNYGFANLYPDNDNVLRQNPLVYATANSLALRIYHRLKSDPVERDLVHPMKIDFRGQPGAYPHYNATQLLAGTQSLPSLNGKVVMVGQVGSPDSDYETPFGKMSALEIQANIADTFVSGREVHILPRWVTWILGLVAVGLSIFVILRFQLTLAWLLLVSLAAGFILVTLFLFSQFQLWWGIGRPIFCIFGTHLVMLGYKLNRQEEAHWKLSQESQYLKEMDEFKNNFISLFSHDLKTPIAKIKAITNRLLGSQPNLDDETKASLKNIDLTSDELGRLISDILKVTKMETMALELNHDVVDINRLVEKAHARLKFLAEQNGVEIRLQLDPLFTIEGDANLLEEVITNLLENAIRYNKPHGHVVIQTSETDGFLKVSVKDEGVGIPKEEIPKVTTKFYRGRNTREKAKGSGLGLYLTKYFVELHRGKLHIASEEGIGSTISFEIPT